MAALTVLLQNVPMAHTKEVHDEIRRLRREEKLSYKMIAKRMSIPLSTVVWWCRRGDAAQAMTSEELRRRLRETQPVRMASIKRTWDNRRSAEVANFVTDWKHRLSDPGFVAPLMLYLAEGNSSGEPGMTNMDGEVIAFVRAWFRKEFDVTDSREVITVQINSDAKITVDEARDV